MTLPNILTLFRLATAPLFLALFIGSGEGNFLNAVGITPQIGLILCLIVAILSEVSDILDGILARRWNQVSNFGKILDPYADSTFRLSIYFSFASQAHGQWIPLWMVMLLFYRDLMVTVIRNFAIHRNEYIQARASGKIKAVVQGGVAITVMVLAIVMGEDWVAYYAHSAPHHSVAYYLMWVVTAFTAWSAYDYVWYNRHLFRKGALQADEIERKQIIAD